MYSIRTDKQRRNNISRTQPTEIIHQDDKLKRGQAALQQLHEISRYESDPFLNDQMSKWIKYQQKSKKPRKVNQFSEEGMVDQTLNTMRKNTNIFNRKDVVFRSRKYTREQQFKNMLKNPRRNVECASKNNFSLVNINISNQKTQRCQRIHSHSIGLNITGSLKAQPKKLNTERGKHPYDREWFKKSKEKTNKARIIPKRSHNNEIINRIMQKRSSMIEEYLPFATLRPLSFQKYQ